VAPSSAALQAKSKVMFFDSFIIFSLVLLSVSIPQPIEGLEYQGKRRRRKVLNGHKFKKCPNWWGSDMRHNLQRIFDFMGFT
jgi:hypothetical protein